MKKRRTRPIAFVLFAVYSLIAVSPLASLAIRSPAMVHTVTGECSGDCATCGCSPERSASHTCCCWMKKKMELEARTGPPSCCLAGEKKGGKAAVAGNSAKKRHVKKRLTLLRCCPCGREKPALPWSTESYPHLPYLFMGEFSNPPGSASADHPPGFLMSRHREPPDPPPKVFPQA